MLVDIRKDIPLVRIPNAELQSHQLINTRREIGRESTRSDDTWIITCKLRLDNNVRASKNEATNGILKNGGVLLSISGNPVQ